MKNLKHLLYPQGRSRFTRTEISLLPVQSLFSTYYPFNRSNQNRMVTPPTYLFYITYVVVVRHVTGNDQDYLGESPEWLFRYLRFSKRATIGVRATYATR